MEWICGIVAVLVVGSLVYNAAYKEGKREGSRKGYGVGYSRGRRSKGNDGCLLMLLVGTVILLAIGLSISA